jgi:Flp pilus assembly protein TadG
MKIRGRVSGRPHTTNGQGLVEFALVIPLILLLFMGIFDFGRAIYAYNTVANAARQGARVAAVNQANPGPPNDTSCAEDQPVENAVTPHMSIRGCAAQAGIALGIQPSSVTVTYAAPAGINLSCSPTLDVGCIATVTVTYSWRALTPVIGNIVGPITMTSTSQIPVERVFP